MKDPKTSPGIRWKTSKRAGNMKPEELRAIIGYLRERVALGPLGAESAPTITFPSPSEEEMLKAGFNATEVKRLLSVPWWGEMEEDIIETPDMCASADSPDQVLEYARDVISEYIYKRFPLQEEQE
jgi:hypothetical protein